MPHVTKLLVLLLFVSTLFAQDQQAAARAAAGCGPNEAHFTVTRKKSEHPVGQPGSEKALVYVFDHMDEDRLQIGAMTTRWGVDGNWVGATDLKSYFFFPLEPGPHRLCTSRQSGFKRINNISTAISFTTEPGKVYYFHVKEPHFDHEHHDDSQVKIVEVDPAEAQILIGKAALSSFKTKQ